MPVIRDQSMVSRMAQRSVHLTYFRVSSCKFFLYEEFDAPTLNRLKTILREAKDQFRNLEEEEDDEIQRQDQNNGNHSHRNNNYYRSEQKNLLLLCRFLLPYLSTLFKTLKMKKRSDF